MQKSTVQRLLVQNLSVLSLTVTLLPVCNSVAWIYVDKQYPTHRCMAMLGKCG